MSSTSPGTAPIDVSNNIPTHGWERELCDAARSSLDQDGVSVKCMVLDDTLEGTARHAICALGRNEDNLVGASNTIIRQRSARDCGELDDRVLRVFTKTLSFDLTEQISMGSG